MTTLNEIRAAIEKVTGCDITDTRRDGPVTDARAAFCYLAVMLTDEKLKEVARFTGLRTHATVLHHYKTTCNMAKSDVRWRIIIYAQWELKQPPQRDYAAEFEKHRAGMVVNLPPER